MFGCRNLLSNEECDECNLKSGTTWETELGHLTLGARAFSGVRAKGGGTPKIKTGGSFIGGGAVIGGTSVTSGDRELFKITGPGRAEIEIPQHPARPAKAAAAIAKMAWLMLSPEERDRHFGIRSLLRDDVSHRSRLYELWIARRIPTTIAIWERIGDHDLAQMIAMLAFGHVVLLWAPPDWETGSPRDLLMPPLPQGADHEGGLVARLFTGNGDDRTLGTTRTVQLAFEQYQRVHAKTPLPVEMVVREGSSEARVSTFALSPADATPTSPHFCLSGGELVGQVEIRDQSGNGDWSWSYQAGSTEGDLDRTIAALEGALRGGSVAVTSPVDHAVLCEGVFPPTAATDATQICQVTRMAYYIGVINRRLGKEIALVDFADDDLTLARWIAAGLTHGRFAQRTENGRFVIGLKASLVEHLATQLGDGAQTVSFRIEETYDLLGTEISVGPTRLLLFEAKLDGNWESLLQTAKTSGHAQASFLCNRTGHVFEEHEVPAAENDGSPIG
jgi:hypothetical protein